MCVPGEHVCQPLQNSSGGPVFWYRGHAKLLLLLQISSITAHHNLSISDISSISPAATELGSFYLPWGLRDPFLPTFASQIIQSGKEGAGKSLCLQTKAMVVLWLMVGKADLTRRTDTSGAWSHVDLTKNIDHIGFFLSFCFVLFFFSLVGAGASLFGRWAKCPQEKIWHTDSPANVGEHLRWLGADLEAFCCD